MYPVRKDMLVSLDYVSSTVVVNAGSHDCEVLYSPPDKVRQGDSKMKQRREDRNTQHMPTVFMN